MHTVDVFPTFLRLATAGPEAAGTLDPTEPTRKEDGVDGLDQWDMIAYAATPPRTTIPLSVFIEDQQMQFGALISGDLKLVSGKPRGADKLISTLDAYFTCSDQAKEPVSPTGHAVVGYKFLFNLTEDPTESENLARRMPDVVADMQSLLDAISASAARSVNTTYDPLADAACLANNYTLIPWLD